MQPSATQLVPSRRRRTFLSSCRFFVAVTAGPAVAVLTIPRQLTWQAEGAHYSINGSSDDLWPSYVSLEHYLPVHSSEVGGSIVCDSGTGYRSALCPSGGYLLLLDHFSSNMLWNYPQMAETLPFSGVRNGPFSSFRSLPSGVAILVQSPQGQVASYTMSGAMRGWSAVETSSYAIHGATVNLQRRLNFDWYQAVMHTARTNGQSGRYQFYDTQQSSVQTQIPAVRVVCAPCQALQRGATSVEFPVLPEFGVASWNYNSLIQVQSINWDSLAHYTPSNASRASWVDLQSVGMGGNC